MFRIWDLAEELRSSIVKHLIPDAHIEVVLVKPRKGEGRTYHVILVNESEWADFRTLQSCGDETRIIIDMSRHTYNPAHPVFRSTFTQNIFQKALLHFLGNFTRLHTTRPVTTTHPGDNDKILRITFKTLMDDTDKKSTASFAPVNDGIEWALHHSQASQSGSIASPYLTRPLTAEGLWAVGNLLADRAGRVATHFLDDYLGATDVRTKCHSRSVKWLREWEERERVKAAQDEDEGIHESE
ncbi:hypothetical protein TI39_contig4202g00055 [Zymoseptoria brevis]|uniref:Uncharacterized protein n=1 Tax=Zymoseptoria brevis TaxID=1047168 RepID=A0A0F4GAC8_9PEZI|nr:hypothetical protein TI39_contig4202g00055 [Zymoseptoria brevis]